MIEPVSVHTVVFRGTGGDSALTWAQSAMWDLVERPAPHDGQSNVPLGVEAGEADGVEHLLHGVALLVERHEAMRTCFVVDEEGTPRQRVIANGELVVKVYDTPAAQADEVLSTVVSAMTAGRFTRDELPVRTAIITQDGAPRWVLFVLSHMAFDGWGAGVVYDDFRRFLVKGTMSKGPGDSPLTPSEQAEHERSWAAGRRGERLETYFRQQLNRFSNVTFPYPVTAGDRPRHQEASVESSTIAHAAGTLADRYGASPAAVLFGAYALVAARLSGRDRCGFSLASANRVTPAERAAASTYFQCVPVVVELFDGPFGDFVRRTMTTVALGYRNGRYPPAVLEEALREVSRERGGWLDLSCSVNLHLQVQGRFRDEDDILPARGRVLQSAPRTRITWRDGRDEAPTTLGFNVWSLSDVAHLSLWADTAVISTRTVEEIVHSLEKVLTSAVACDNAVGVRELSALITLPGPGNDLVDADGFWVDPDAVREVIREVVGSDAVGVFVTEPVEGDRFLTAYVAPPRRDGGVSDLRRTLLRRIRQRRFGAVPRRLVVCTEAPRDVDDPVAWAAQEVLSEGEDR